MKRPTRATVALAVALFSATTTPITFLVTQASEERDVKRIQDLRQARVADAARADMRICEGQNAVLTVLLKSDVEPVEFDSSRPPLTPAEETLLRKYLVKLNCQNLPSSKPFRR